MMETDRREWDVRSEGKETFITPCLSRITLPSFQPFKFREGPARVVHVLGSLLNISALGASCIHSELLPCARSCHQPRQPWQDSPFPLKVLWAVFLSSHLTLWPPRFSPCARTSQPAVRVVEKHVPFSTSPSREHSPFPRPFSLWGQNPKSLWISITPSVYFKEHQSTSYGKQDSVSSS